MCVKHHTHVNLLSFNVVSITVNEARYSLFDDLELEGENLLLSSLNQNDKVFHLIKPDEIGRTFLLGRSHTADIRLNNKYTSRAHAQIIYTGKGFVLSDMNSKYGTLVLLCGKQQLYKERNLSVQVNSSIITLGIKEKRISSMQQASTSVT
jgi:pSer/pThr/pTyr-binding forkhead associated (FHA) protein